MTKHAKQLRENIEETNFHMEGTVVREMHEQMNWLMHL